MSQIPSFAIDGALAMAARFPRRGGGGAPLLVVTYHRVLPAPDPLLPSEPDEHLFRAQVSYLATHCRLLGLAEAVAGLRDGSLPNRAVCISFDDGYANNAQVALPILEEAGATATFFIATGYLDGGCMWNDGIIEAVRGCASPALDLRPLGLGSYAIGDTATRRAAIAQLLNQVKYRPLAERSSMAGEIARIAGVTLPTDLMMSSADVRHLADRGMEIGGHTVNHPILARIPDDEAWREITDGRDALARITGSAPQTFAYPNGRPGQDFGPAHPAMVREAGFIGAVTTGWGYGQSTSDPWLLPRVTLWSATPGRLTANLASIYLRSGR